LSQRIEAIINIAYRSSGVGEVTNEMKRLGRVSGNMNQQMAKANAGIGDYQVGVKSNLAQLNDQIKMNRVGFGKFRDVIKNGGVYLKDYNNLLSATVTSTRDVAGNMNYIVKPSNQFGNNVATLGQRLKLANVAMGAMATHTVNLGKNMQWAGRQIMVGFTVPLGFALVALSKLGYAYDETITKIVKVSDFQFEAGDAFDAQRAAVERQTDSIVKLSAAMGQLPTATAAAVAEFTQMGYGGAQLDQLTEAAVRFSRVAGTDLENSIEFTRIAAQAFGVELEDLEQTFANLNYVENNTALGMEELAEGLPIVAAVADQLGISIEETAGLMAMQKEAGIEANEAATALRTGLLRLVQDATNPATEAFNKLGVSLEDIKAQGGGSIAMLTRLGEEAQKFDALTGEVGEKKREDFAAAISKLFGVRQASRMIAVLRQLPDIGKSGSDAARAWSAVVEGTQEATDAMRVYKIEEELIRDSAAGQRESLNAQIQYELLDVSETVTELLNHFREMALQVLQWMNSLEERTKKAMLSLVGALGVLGPVTMGLGLFANAVGQVVNAVHKLGKLAGLKDDFSPLAAIRAAYRRGGSTPEPMPGDAGDGDGLDVVTSGRSGANSGPPRAEDIARAARKADLSAPRTVGIPTAATAATETLNVRTRRVFAGADSALGTKADDVNRIMRAAMTPSTRIKALEEAIEKGIGDENELRDLLKISSRDQNTAAAMQIAAASKQEEGVARFNRILREASLAQAASGKSTDFVISPDDQDFMKKNDMVPDGKGGWQVIPRKRAHRRTPKDLRTGVSFMEQLGKGEGGIDPDVRRQVRANEIQQELKSGVRSRTGVFRGFDPKTHRVAPETFQDWDLDAKNRPIPISDRATTAALRRQKFDVDGKPIARRLTAGKALKGAAMLPFAPFIAMGKTVNKVEEGFKKLAINAIDLRKKLSATGYAAANTAVELRRQAAGEGVGLLQRTRLKARAAGNQARAALYGPTTMAGTGLPLTGRLRKPELSDGPGKFGNMMAGVRKNRMGSMLLKGGSKLATGAVGGAAAAALVALTVPIMADFEKFKEGFMEFMGRIKSAGRSFMAPIKDAVLRIKDVLGSMTGEAGEGMANLSTMAQTLGRWIGAAVEQVIRFGTIIVETVAPVVGGLVESIMWFAQALGQLFSKDWEGFLSSLLEGVKALLRGLIQGVNSLLASVLDTVGNAMNNIISGTGDMFTNLADSLREATDFEGTWLASDVVTSAGDYLKYVNMIEDAQKQVNQQQETGLEIQEALAKEGMNVSRLTTQQILDHKDLNDNFKMDLYILRESAEVMQEMEEIRARILALEVSDDAIPDELIEDLKELEERLAGLPQEASVEVGNAREAAAFADEIGRLTGEVDDLGTAEEELADRLEAANKEIEAQNELIEEANERHSEWVSTLRSSSSEVVSDIVSAVNQAMQNQKDALAKRFDEMLEKHNSTYDSMLAAAEEKHQRELDQIDEARNAELERLEKQQKAEEDLDRQREIAFQREIRRMEYLENLERGMVDYRENIARGRTDEAAKVQIGMRYNAERFMLQERNIALDEAAEAKPDVYAEKADKVNTTADTRIENLESQYQARLAQLENIRVKEEEAIIASRESAEAAMDLRHRLIQNYLREWARVTPATEAEFQAHLGRLQSALGGFGLSFGDVANEYQNSFNSEMENGFDRTMEIAQKVLGEEAKWKEILESGLVAALESLTEEDILAAMEAEAAARDAAREKRINDASTARWNAIAQNKGYNPGRMGLEAVEERINSASTSRWTGLAERMGYDMGEGLSGAMARAVRDNERRTEGELKKSFTNATDFLNPLWLNKGKGATDRFIVGWDVDSTGNKRAIYSSFETATSGIPGLARSRGTQGGDRVRGGFVETLQGRYTQGLIAGAANTGMSGINSRAQAMGSTSAGGWRNTFTGVVGNRSTTLALARAFQSPRERVIGWWKATGGSSASNWMQQFGRQFAANNTKNSSGQSTRTGAASAAEWMYIKLAHSGGAVESTPLLPGMKNDESLYVLQHGEYVVQRDAVKNLGEDYMDQLNSMKKHTGGAINIKGTFSDMSSKIGDPMSDWVELMTKERMGAASNEGSANVDYGAQPLLKAIAGLGGLAGMWAGRAASFGTAGAVSPNAKAVGEASDWRYNTNASDWPPRKWATASANTLAAQRFIIGNWDTRFGAGLGLERGVVRSDHSWGKAIDAMVSPLGRMPNSEQRKQGWEMANWFTANPDVYGTKYVIWDKMINSGTSQGWRPYTRYGSNPGPTLGHYDHVHLSFKHDGGMIGKTPQLMSGGRINYDNTIANLHKGETVLTAPLTQSLEQGIARMEAGGGDTYQFYIDGGAQDPEQIASAVMRKIEQKKARAGQRGRR